jgi:hypothetical protein
MAPQGPLKGRAPTDGLEDEAAPPRAAKTAQRAVGVSLRPSPAPWWPHGHTTGTQACEFQRIAAETRSAR